MLHALESLKGSSYMLILQPWKVPAYCKVVQMSMLLKFLDFFCLKCFIQCCGMHCYLFSVCMYRNTMWHRYIYIHIYTCIWYICVYMILLFHVLNRMNLIKYMRNIYVWLIILHFSMKWECKHIYVCHLSAILFNFLWLGTFDKLLMHCLNHH